MQEENKVELDTDDVKEEDVSIEEKPKEEKPEKVEVDLGYSDPIKQETKAKVVEEEKPQQEEKKETEDNLQEVSQNVQKRIDQLTRKMREAERREKAAIDFAKGLQKNMTQQIKSYRLLMIVILKNLKLVLMRKENKSKQL
jgi:phenylalanyl-tRNA synthetase alpha subunit